MELRADQAGALVVNISRTPFENIDLNLDDVLASPKGNVPDSQTSNTAKSFCPSSPPLPVVDIADCLLISPVDTTSLELTTSAVLQTNQKIEDPGNRSHNAQHPYITPMEPDKTPNCNLVRTNDRSGARQEHKPRDDSASLTIARIEKASRRGVGYTSKDLQEAQKFSYEPKIPIWKPSHGVSEEPRSRRRPARIGWKYNCGNWPYWSTADLVGAVNIVGFGSGWIDESGRRRRVSLRIAGIHR
jgi:hypothetical protein